MPVTGKMTVDLYANPDPFIQGMKAAENSAKKSGEGIAGHISKINAKQLKGLTHEVLGGLGTIGLIDEGAKMALELVKGFKEGSVKNFSDAVSVVGNTLVTGLKAIPIAGTFLAIGEQIGNMVFGVDKANESIKLMNEQMARTNEISKLLFASKANTESDMAALQKKNDDYGKSSDQIASELFVANRKKEIEAIRLKMNADVALQSVADRKEMEDVKGQFTYDEKTGVRNQLQKQKYSEDEIIKRENQRYNNAKTFQENSLNNISSETQAYNDQQKIYNDKLLATQQFNSEQDAILNSYDAEESAQEQINKLTDKANESLMTARDAELERLSNLDGITASMLSQGIAAWDLETAGKANAKIIEEQLSAQEELSKANMGVNEAGANLDAAQSNRTASATSVDTALGSIKIQGVSDFSKSKEIEKAQQALAAAQTTVTNTKAIADGIAKLVQINGGTP
jgi:hypothetical protein